MNIEVISCQFREYYLAPLFMRHYEPWVEQITVITKRLEGKRADGQAGFVLDDHVKMGWINEAVQQSKADWIICVDADEFVFPLPYTDPASYGPVGHAYRNFLANVPAHHTHIIAELPRIWLHATDAEVDFSRAPVPQRVHGEAVVPEDYKKPCIFRNPKTFNIQHSTPNVQVGIGCHNLHGVTGSTLHPVRWGGAHWQMATRLLRSERRMQDRISRIAAQQYAWQVKHLPTAEQMEREVREHLNDPVVIHT